MRARPAGTLPAAEAGERTVGATFIAVQAKMNPPGTDAQPVLIIQEDGDAPDRLRAELDALGCRVVCARNAADALARIRDQAPQVILLDAATGGGEAPAICRQLQADAEAEAIPVLLLAPEAGAADRAAALEAGALDYVLDPFDRVELRARLASALRLKQLQDELRCASVRDGLTGLLSRAFFAEQFERECNRSRRYESLFALAMVDVDRFGEVNERHGRASGDAVLRDIAAILRATTRESDSAARWARDEFIVLLPEANLRRATGFAKKLHRQIAEHDFSCCGRNLEITVSMAIASRQNIGGKDPAEMLPLVRKCLAAAKDAGGGRTFYHSCGEFNLVRM